MAVELSRVIGGAPQLVTIGADKTLAIWDTISFKVIYQPHRAFDLYLKKVFISIKILRRSSGIPVRSLRRSLRILCVLFPSLIFSCLCLLGTTAY